VFKELKELIEKIGKDGSFILSSGCMIPRTAAKENLAAMISVASESKY